VEKVESISFSLKRLMMALRKKKKKKKDRHWQSREPGDK
jgi:hypothetical protein